MTEAFDAPCPCGSGEGYHRCCGPLHHGERHPVTAEELMRSRFCAYARDDADYLFRTWHPRTRPAEVATGGGIVWTDLEIRDTEAGGPEDDRGEVEFVARYESSGQPGTMHERSRFERRGGRWCYVDAAR